MRCQSCGSDNPEGVNFCIECAAPFKNRCPNCGFENLARAKFCGECATPLAQQPQGHSLKSKVENLSDSRPQTLDPRPVSYTPKHLAERILAEQAAMEARGAIEGERKTITALFADIKGSMDLIEPLDPEEARSIIDPALQFMMDAVHRYEGYVAQSTGDGIFALFGAPLACEDHPQRALYAALRMQEEGKRFAEQLRLEKGLNFQIRVGLNTGEMVLRSIRKDDLHTDYIPIGHSTSLASRMEGLATPGSIVVSEHTYKLAKGYFEFKSLGAAGVKGVSEPINIYEVLGVALLRTRLQVAVKRGLVRFVGRQTEMEQLRWAIEQVQASHGQIVGVVGEPGVGKSRLFHEFVGVYGCTPLPSPTGCLVLETFSVSHGKAYPYLPLIDLLKNYFQIAPQDDERKRREKVGGKMLMLDRTLEDMLPYLFALLGISEPTSSLAQMDPQIRKQRTLEAIKRLLVRESLNQPLILIFEDLHWLDAETQAFLSLLGESIATARILLLVNYRPEYRHEWGSKTFYTQLRLDSLGKEDAQELLTALLGDRTELPDLKRLIVEKTEGNPFFMEEIVQALVEQGVLADPRRVGSAHPHVGGHGFGLVPATGHAPLPTDLHIPTTVQAVLASRIDRLPPEEKEFLQTLSVIGKEFPFSLLKQVVNKSEDELQRLLSQLQAAEFIYEQPAFPEVEYTFKHALTQEVSYNSLLIERRKILHERTAQVIEMLFRSQLEDHYGDLAHHYSYSGNIPKAVEYLQRSGQQAAQRSAYAEASGHFTAALGLLKNLPDTPERAQQELTLQLALAASLQATKGPSAPEVGQAYTRARALCQEGEETPQLFSVLRGLWVLHHVRAELSAARELGEQLLSMAKRVQDPALLLEAHRALGSTLLWQGEFPLARAHLEQASALYDPQLHRSLTFLHGGADPGVSCFCELARVLWFLGYPDQALQRSQAALLLAQSLSDPFSVGFALIFAAGIHQFRREGYATQKWAEEGITLASEQGFASLVFAGTIRRGWALTEQGQVEAGLTQMQQGLTARQTTGAELAQPYFLALQAEVYGKVGQIKQARSLLAEALTAVQTNGERRLEAELYRLKGELSLQSRQVWSKSQASLRQVKTGQDKSKINIPQSAFRNPQLEAEACFLKAIEIARRQQAKSLELRAVMSLSRLWRQQSKREEARRMLAEIYGWFTEGFDTADLKDAKALLEELEGKTKRTTGEKNPKTKRGNGETEKARTEEIVPRFTASPFFVYYKEGTMPKLYQDHTLTLRGLRFHYLDWGSEGKPPFVCLHGGAQTAHSWDDFAPVVRDDHHVYTLDQRGHGDSDWAPDGDYSRQTQCEDVAAFVSALGLSPFILAGLSMGGINAITYTARYPEQVRALIIVDVGPEIETRGREKIQNFTRIDELDSFEAFIERAHRFNPRRSLENLRQRLSHNLKQLPSGKWTWKFDQKRLGAGGRSGIGPEGLWEDVRKIHCPTLIVRGGESDILAPEAAERMRAAIPHSRVTVVPGAGHSVMGDNPAGFAAAVQEFLRAMG